VASIVPATACREVAMLQSLYPLLLLACPAGMGLMMWLMMRGSHGERAAETEVAELREQIQRMRAATQNDPVELSKN
jgi:hypothetical protein